MANTIFLCDSYQVIKTVKNFIFGKYFWLMIVHMFCSVIWGRVARQASCRQFTSNVVNLLSCFSVATSDWLDNPLCFNSVFSKSISVGWFLRYTRSSRQDFKCFKPLSLLWYSCMDCFQLKTSRSSLIPSWCAFLTMVLGWEEIPW